MATALGPPGLQHVELAILDRELHVLDVAEVALQRVGHPLELQIGALESGVQRTDRLGIAGPRDDIFSLGVREELTVELALAGGGVPGEHHAGARLLAEVPEDHRDHADGSPHRIGNVMQAPIVDCAAGIPALEDRRNCAPELFHRLIGEGVARVIGHQRLEPGDQGLQGRKREIDFARGPMGVLRLVEQHLERGLRYAEDDGGIHLHESPITVPREGGIVAPLGQPLHRVIVEAEVQDGLHHAWHRDCGTAAHRHEQRVLFAAKFLAGGGLEPLQCSLHLGTETGRKGPRLEIGLAHGRGNREPGRDGYSEIGHFGEAGALAAEEILHGGRAVGATQAEEVHQRLLREWIAHVAAATRGVECRHWPSVSCTGVG